MSFNEIAFKWNRDMIQQLIICVEQNPCVFNIKSAEYLDRNKKAEAYNSILEEMQKMDSNITLGEIKRKWKILRTQYMKEIRSMEQSKKSGSGIEDLYVPKLWCFENLKFLKSCCNMRVSKDNTEENNSQTEEPTVSQVEEEDRNPEEPLKKRVKASGSFSAINKRLEEFKTIVAEKKSKKKFAWLGNLVTEQMERINPEDQDEAAWQVQCLMRKLVVQYSQKNQDSNASASSSRDIIELSMEGLFDEEDFN